MASNQLVARIALEGGEEVRKQLAQIGAGGEQQLLRLKGTIEGVSGALGGLGGPGSRGAAALAQLRVAGADVHQSMQNLQSSLSTVVTRLTVFTAGIAAAAFGVSKFVSGASTAADAAGDMGEAMGLTQKEVGAFSVLASQTGVDVDAIQRALGKFSVSAGEARNRQAAFNRELTEARNNGGDVTEILARQAKQVRESTDVFDKLGLSTQRLTAGERWIEFADKISLVTDETDRFNFVVDAVGRKGAPKMMEQLLKGADGFNAAMREGVRLGTTFTQKQTDIGQAATIALSRVGDAMRGIRNQVGLVFAADQTTGANAFAEILIGLRPKFVAIAETIRNIVKPAFDDFLLIISGNSAEVRTQWIIDLVNGFKVFGAVVAFVVQSVVIPAYQALVQVAQNVADVINRIFGTNISGQALLIAAALIYLSGVFGALAATIAVVVAGAGFLAAGIAFLVATFGALPAILIVVGAMFTAWLLTTTNVVKNVSDAFTGLFSTISDGAARAVKWLLSIADAARSAAQFVAKAIGGGGGEAAPGLAGGGHVRGRGTGTSDSILSWLSDEEFVIKTEAVRKYGASLFAAFNSMRIPAGRFNAGGLVDSLRMTLPPIPGFADGGLVPAPASSGKSLTIVLDGKAFNLGTVGNGSAVDQLERYALNARIRSAGRKPGWIS